LPTLNSEISQPLMSALKLKAKRTNATEDEIVTRALADELQFSHATLFQVSTSGAIVEGATKGVITVRELKRHGDFGLGTFADLDGEMVAFDGHFWRVPAFGGLREAADFDLTPFAVVTAFQPERTNELPGVGSFVDLERKLDSLRDSNNLFIAVRIDGEFTHAHTRSLCKTALGPGLLEAASHQAEFDFENVAGTIVGFWTPEYAKAIGVTGWHLHFLNENRSGGGHLLDVEANTLKTQIQHLHELRVVIPEGLEFLHADLTQDTSMALDRAERSVGARRTQ